MKLAARIILAAGGALLGLAAFAAQRRRWRISMGDLRSAAFRYRVSGGGARLPELARDRLRPRWLQLAAPPSDSDSDRPAPPPSSSSP